jgi:mannose-6-phosphate isomerase-like protein (cupin superfamily)
MERPSWFVPAGQDRDGRHRGLGIGSVAFKVLPRETGGALFVFELTNHSPGGPPKHLHHEQDEWFYVVEGAYLIEIGEERVRLGPGDSVFGPRKVPHTWTFTGGSPGRMLIGFTPAGQMEAFMNELGRRERMAQQEPKLFSDHGMELVGPPLALE